MRSAMRFKMSARSAAGVRPQAGAAAWAASSAASTSAALERCTSHSGWPVTGERLVKVSPVFDGTNLPLMKLP